MKTSDIAWASGLFDGEGWITAHAKDGRRYLRLGLGMTDEDSVRRFHEAVGVGAVRFDRRKLPASPLWAWGTSSFEDGQAVIAMLWPGLNARRRARAVEVLALVRSNRTYRRVTPLADGDADMRRLEGMVGT